MILLPHGCHCSTPIVNPSNWKRCGKSALKKTWRITYRFYDPRKPDKPEWGKLIPVKGMNHLKTIEERRHATRIILEELHYDLTVLGYNPLTDTYNGQEEAETYEIHPDSLFCNALESAFEKLDKSPKTIAEIKSVKKYFLSSVRALRYDRLRISDVKRRHVRSVLDHQAKTNKYSANRYNSVRSYVQMLFKVLLEFDTIEYNAVDKIPKKRTIKRIRETLTDAEFKKVKTHLNKSHYNFYRYMMIFYYSGCRSTELLDLKRKDVLLDRQLFKVTVLKGGVYQEEYRAINNYILYLWEEVCKPANRNDYLFGSELRPGKKKLQKEGITRRWKRHVKDKLNITADFYALKHKRTTKVSEYYGNLIAAGANGHKSTKMNDTVYDQGREAFLLEQAKSIKV